MSWSGVKNQVNKADIEAWCEEMHLRNYNVNSKGEIDVDGNVTLDAKGIVELPYKFGEVRGWFSLSANKDLISLKNCPDRIAMFDIDSCPNLYSLEGCPKEVRGDFYCRKCGAFFKPCEVEEVCNVGGSIKYL